ncbi:MAG: hypothetical protein Q9157_003745, partial [Trypethelium eluteriae]
MDGAKASNARDVQGSKNGGSMGNLRTRSSWFVLRKGQKRSLLGVMVLPMPTQPLRLVSAVAALSFHHYLEQNSYRHLEHVRKSCGNLLDAISARIEDFPMNTDENRKAPCTPAPSNLLKRRRSHQYPFELEGEACQTASKKHKAIHTPNPTQTATSQDNSSPIPLEKRALKELRRINDQAARESRAKHQVHRPATRLATAEWRRCNPSPKPLKPAHTYLMNCGDEQYKNLQSFARHGGPDLWELRGCQRSALYVSNILMDSGQASLMSRSRDRQSTTEGGISKSLSAYNRTFQQILVDNHVYPPDYEHPGGIEAPEPENWDYINERLARPRPSLSPSKFSKEQHKAFKRLNSSAVKEGKVKRKVIPIIEGTVKDPRTESGEIPFTNLVPLVTTENLVSGNPDFYYGARPEQLDRRVREELGQFITPSTQHDQPILPNHFTAAKGPDGTAAVAERQATYHSYFGARGQLHLRNYGRGELQFDNNAYTVSTIYNSGTLSIFTNHPTPPKTPGGQPNYYMTRVRSFAMNDTPETWRDGAKYYRNSMDMAKEFRNEAIDTANEAIANRDRAPVPVSAAITQLPSNTTNNTATLTTSFASTVTSQQLDVDTLAMQSQPQTQVFEPTPSVTSDDFQTAESAHGQDSSSADADQEEEEEEEEDDNDADDFNDDEEEEEEEPAAKPRPAKRATRSRRPTLEEEEDSRRRKWRNNHQDGTSSQ